MCQYQTKKTYSRRRYLYKVVAMRSSRPYGLYRKGHYYKDRVNVSDRDSVKLTQWERDGAEPVKKGFHFFVDPEDAAEFVRTFVAYDLQVWKVRVRREHEVGYGCFLGGGSSGTIAANTAVYTQFEYVETIDTYKGCMWRDY